MNLQQIKADIAILRRSIILQTEPANKIFIFRANGLTDAGETEDDLKEYSILHPHTHVLKLIRKSCRQA